MGDVLRAHIGQGASQLPKQACSTSKYNHKKGEAIPQDRVRPCPGLGPGEHRGSRMQLEYH